MSITTRTLKPQDKAVAMSLWGDAFGREEPYYSGFFDTFYHENNALGLFCDHELVTVGFILPQKVRVRGKVLRSAFLVGITTNEKHRGKGFFKMWMLEMLEHLKKEGYDLSMLVPFETPFYKPFGFETCYALHTWKIPLSNLPKCERPEVSSVSELSELSHIYEAFVKDYHGTVLRETHDWAHVSLEMSAENASAFKLNDDTGYAILSLKDRTLRVLEWAYLSPKSQKALLGYFASFLNEADEVWFQTPLDDLLIYRLDDKISPDRLNTVTLLPYQSVRVLEPSKLFEKLGISADVSAYTIGEISQMVMGVYDGMMPGDLSEVFDRKTNFMRENYM